MKTLIACLALVVAAAGCGPRRQSAGITGMVSFAGTPVADGSIRLHHAKGTPGPGGAARIEGGRFRIEPGSGLWAGDYRVEILGWRPTGRQTRVIDDAVPGRAGVQPGAGTTQADIEQFIPAAYNLQTGLTATLAPGDNVVEFALEGDAAPGR